MVPRMFTVVVVLSREFVRKKAPMEELRLALQRVEETPKAARILPVFLEVSVEDCTSVRRLYDSWTVEWGPKPDDEVLKVWENTLKGVQQYTGVRSDQVTIQPCRQDLLLLLRLMSTLPSCRITCKPVGDQVPTCIMKLLNARSEEPATAGARFWRAPGRPDFGQHHQAAGTAGPAAQGLLAEVRHRTGVARAAAVPHTETSGARRQAGNSAEQP